MIPLLTAFTIILLCLATGMALGVAAGAAVSAIVERWVNR